MPSTFIEEDQVLNQEHLELIQGVIPIHRTDESDKFSRISEVSENSVSTNQTEDNISEYSSKIPKVGSLQSFVKSMGPIENFSSDLFHDDEIHKIAVLDLRILNLDRNTENILVQREG